MWWRPPKSIDAAAKKFDEVGVRTRAIQRKLRDVQELPAPDAATSSAVPGTTASLLGLEDDAREHGAGPPDCRADFLHACMTGMRMATPLLALREGYSAVAVGVLAGAVCAHAGVSGLPAGRYADRHGLKRPWALRWSWRAGGRAFADFPVFSVMCLSALMTGGATGLAIIALQRHVGRAAHDTTQLRQVFSWLAIGPAVSNFIGPFFCGLMIDHAGSTAGSTEGHRAAFALLAVLPLATWFWVRHTEELPPVIAAAGGPPQRSWDLLNEPAFRRLIIVNWVLSSCWDVHTFVVPLIGTNGGCRHRSSAPSWGAFAVAAAAVRLLLPLVAACA